MKRQIRISDTHFKELEFLSLDLGLKKPEILGMILGIVKTLRLHKAKSIKILSGDDKEIEIILPVDLSS